MATRPVSHPTPPGWTRLVPADTPDAAYTLTASNGTCVLRVDVDVLGNPRPSRPVSYGEFLTHDEFAWASAALADVSAWLGEARP